MIDIKSLRLGNILKDHKGNLREVAYITECVGLKNDIGGVDKYQKDPITSYDIETLSYVDLSEDILLKAGFNWNITGTALWDSNEFLISKDEDGYYFGVWASSNGDEYPIFVMTLDYLHTLQNAYRLKTNKELIINF